MSGSRVPKFQHNAEKELDLIKAESALIAELLNRGPQTTGELNTRSTRMFEFDGFQDVEDSLQDMMERSPSLAGIMDPRPGQKEKDGFINLVHLLLMENLKMDLPYMFLHLINDWKRWKKSWVNLKI